MNALEIVFVMFSSLFLSLVLIFFSSFSYYFFPIAVIFMIIFENGRFSLQQYLLLLFICNFREIHIVRIFFAIFVIFIIILENSWLSLFHFIFFPFRKICLVCVFIYFYCVYLLFNEPTFSSALIATDLEPCLSQVRLQQLRNSTYD